MSVASTAWLFKLLVIAQYSETRIWKKQGFAAFSGPLNTILGDKYIKISASFQSKEGESMWVKSSKLNINKKSKIK